MTTESAAPSTARIVRFHELGSADVLKLEELPLPEPGPGEVRLRVQAFGLNRAEVVFRQGRYFAQPIFPSHIGYEASGVVEAVGAGVDAGLVGQKRSTVPCFAVDKYGVYGEVAIVPAYALAAYPERLTAEEATSIWMQYLTAYGALVQHGHVGAGDFVVISAASSSVGLAAIEIVKAEGGVSIATTRTAAKKAELLALGADHVVVTDEEDFVARVAEITGGKGARLIFDPVAGPWVEKLAQAAAHGGVIYLYGALGGVATPFPLVLGMRKSLTIRGYLLGDVVSDTSKRAVAEKYVFDKLERGEFKPRIAKTFALEDVVAAHKYLESNEQVGKVVVTVP